MIMSTQMRVAEQAEGWAILNGEKLVSFDGATHQENRAVLVAAIEARGLHVWTDGSISKDPEPKTVEEKYTDLLETVASISEPVSGNDPEPTYTPEPAPPTEDPPTDPNADPEDPDPNPTVPVKPKRARRVKLVADNDALVAGAAEAKAALKDQLAEVVADSAKLIEETDRAVAQTALKAPEGVVVEEGMPDKQMAF